MILAFAPRIPRGCSWVFLTIVAVMAGSPRLAQAQKPGDEAAAKAAGAAAKKADEAKPDATASQPPDDDRSAPEIFTDPNAKKARDIFNPLFVPSGAVRPSELQSMVQTMQSMAVGSVNLDQAFIKRYIEYHAVELSKKENLNAILNPPDKVPPNRGLERAVDALINPLLIARANTDKSGTLPFLAAYTRALFDSSLVKLLDNNLLSRIDAMIVLGFAGSPANNALDLYVNQIKKEDQVVWVKQWAARGLTNASQEGKQPLDASRAIAAVDALVAWIDGDPKLPYPAQYRAFQALGSIRLPVVKTREGSVVDAASLALKFVTDPEAKPLVRAEAAWALGMFRVPDTLKPYNYALVGHEIGKLAASIGDEIIEEFDANPNDFDDKGGDYAKQLASLLIFQVYVSISGQEGVNDSGLNRAPAGLLGNAKPFLTGLDAKVKDVAREAYELMRAGGAAQKARRDDLKNKIADLRVLLEKSAPKDRHLVPNGPEFPAKADQVAHVPGH